MQPIGFIAAAGYLKRGWQLVRKPGLRRFVVVPLLINVAVFAVLGWLLFGMVVYAFTLLANLIGAPFNSLLAERVEMHLTGTTPSSDPSLTFLIKSIPSTLRSEFAKLFYLALWSIPLLVLGFIPVINIVAPVLVFGFGAWMFALEYIDYPMGNRGMLFKDIKRTLRQNRPMALGFGAMVAIFSIIPLVNLVIMPIAVAGGTALFVDHLKDGGDDTLTAMGSAAPS